MKRTASARRRSRSSRLSGTTLNAEVLGFLGLAGGADASAARLVTVQSFRRGNWWMPHMATAGAPQASASEGRHGKKYRVEPFEIPELGEVKTNGFRGF